MNNNISETNINIKFNYDNFHELIQYAIADSLTVDGKKISKDLPQVDRLETELLEKDFEIQYLKKQLEILKDRRKQYENNGQN